MLVLLAIVHFFVEGMLEAHSLMYDQGARASLMDVLSHILGPACCIRYMCSWFCDLCRVLEMRFVQVFSFCIRVVQRVWCERVQRAKQSWAIVHIVPGFLFHSLARCAGRFGLFRTLDVR